MERNCLLCDTAFTVPARAPGKVYCSDKCRRKAETIRMRGVKRKKSRPHKLTCQHCGKEFMADKKDRQFCSKSCRSKQLYIDRPELRESSRQSMNEIRQRPEVQRKLDQHLNSKSNPFHDPVVKAKAKAALREKGYAHLTGGNGQGLTVPQMLLQQRLGWTAEYVVPTRAARNSGLPSHYKIDLAEPVLKIAIEIDGQSHEAIAAKERDAKKDSFLELRGWRVLRFKNREILEEIDHVVMKIMEAVKSST